MVQLSCFSKHPNLGLGLGNSQEPEFVKLNESVWQLYPSPSNSPSVVTPTVEVVFFHGLRRSNYKEAFWKTWRSRDKTVIWPQAWLGPSLPGARILSVSYDSAQEQRNPRDPFKVTENLSSDLDAANVGQHCPVILVGHSLGGIIIKKVLLQYLERKGRTSSADKSLARLENFLRNCKGVFYYSSPHGGSKLADYALITLGCFLHNPMISLLRRLSTKTAIINREFAMAKHNLGDGGIRTRAIGESVSTNLVVFKSIVVEHASAMQDVDGGFYTAPLADHYRVCKPKDTTDPIFTYLLSFIADVLESANVLRPAENPSKTNLQLVNESTITGTRASSKSRMERPPGIKMLNESVYQLYAPSSDPQIEVVFFHGLQPSHYEKAFWKTWLSRDGTTVWPKDWLSTTLSSARILTISYDAIARSHRRWTKPSIIAENLIQDMIDDARVGQTCPVVLVGHSFGGIIIKKVIVECLRKTWLLNPAKYPQEAYRVQNFLRNCAGVFFYSTPHQGSNLGMYAKQTWKMNDPFINLLKTLDFPNDENHMLDRDFFSTTDNSGKGRIKVESIGESLPTKYMGFRGRVVDDASASYHHGNVYTAPGVNHFDVCKPQDSNDRIFTQLRDFVSSFLPVPPQATPAVKDQIQR